jgi:hypothetical protein
MLIRRFFAIVLLSSVLPMNLFAKEKPGTSIYFETFVANTYWENWANDKWDEFGPALFLTPRIRQYFGRAFLETSFTWHYTKINDPGGLTINTQEDDIDIGFRTSVERKDISFKVGYNWTIFALSINIKRTFLQLNATHKLYHRFHYKYYDKGFIIGPGLNVLLPLKKGPKIIIEFERLGGNLNTYYLKSLFLPNKPKISSRLFTAKAGVIFPFSKNMDLALYCKFEDYNKEAIFNYTFFYPTDLRNFGIAAELGVHF